VEKQRKEKVKDDKTKVKELPSFFRKMVFLKDFKKRGRRTKGDDLGKRKVFCCRVWLFFVCVLSEF